MASMNLKDISKRLRKIDFCMFNTHTASGEIKSRPMSNNGDVDYEGDSWFFSYEDTRKVREIEANNRVSLIFTEPPSILGKPGIFISLDGQASLIRDKARFEEHWTSELDRWFPDGVGTPGVVLVQVNARTIEYWDGEDNGTVSLV
ncbi:pyridoxamine 5'-phosphate oxidase family protein [Agrobacterium larrymoorei]|uniref:pyridoxamine 5'-phosphate oxidase family protein n=1 Tax=Agrobacterium larrymoorei TaxID=160699 RepID=UPI0015722932|nr:pyridoxamine 5'-phosphate oxidase family protein [Agrobacterium larrymoorei]NTJ43903.1 pyridoxamine 5'-phosphate oxidase family protein [Agrobacterium larrymoorei]